MEIFPPPYTRFSDYVKSQVGEIVHAKTQSVLRTLFAASLYVTKSYLRKHPELHDHTSELSANMLNEAMRDWNKSQLANNLLQLQDAPDHCRLAENIAQLWRQKIQSEVFGAKQ